MASKRQLLASLVAASLLASNADLQLSPVFGSLPAGRTHQLVVSTCYVLGIATLAVSSQLPATCSLLLLRFCRPACLSLVLLAQRVLLRFSRNLGAQYGPLIVELLTLAPCLIALGYFAALSLQRLCERRMASWTTRSLVAMAAALGAFVAVHSALGVLLDLLHQGELYFRPTVGPAAVVVAAQLGGRRRNEITLAAVLVCVTIATYLINANSMRDSGFTTLSRRDSVTGYISVFESATDEFRALRCDHSLLGGEWLATPERVADGMVLPEPIYGVFTMLEAVRLMQASDGGGEGAGGQLAALVIGLGVGTCPAALSRYGINTTAVELDPAVVRFARDYFNLPSNVSVRTQDAQQFVREAADARYDLIVHDVFTGGAEPLALFTTEFLQGLKRLMKPTAHIALNYGGDASQASSSVVIRTIRRVFGNCKAFRDAPPKDGTIVEEDFVNLVLFCSKDNSREWAFRPAVEGDYLRSQARRMSLPPGHELPLADLDEDEEESTSVLCEDNVRTFEALQVAPAVEHWALMRTVIPDIVWEGW